MHKKGVSFMWKPLSTKEAIEKAGEVYEKSTGRKVGSGSKREKIGAYLFFGSIILLAIIYFLKMVLL